MNSNPPFSFPKASQGFAIPFLNWIRKIYILLVGFAFLHPGFSFAQQTLSNQRAREIIATLESNPIQTDSKKMADSLAQWLDDCRQVVVYITKDEMDNVMDSKFLYSREMYVLLLGGMARYDLDHPDDNPEIKKVDADAGLQCMCNGFHSLSKAQGKMKQSSYFKKICKNYPQNLVAQQSGNP